MPRALTTAGGEWAGAHATTGRGLAKLSPAESNHWTPGQGAPLVVRLVPQARMGELSSAV